MGAWHVVFALEVRCAAMTGRLGVTSFLDLDVGQFAGID